jgi:hypothetical protein
VSKKVGAGGETQPRDQGMILIGMLGLDRHLAALVLRRPIAHVYGSVFRGVCHGYRIGQLTANDQRAGTLSTVRGDGCEAKSS